MVRHCDSDFAATFSIEFWFCCKIEQNFNQIFNF